MEIKHTYIDQRAEQHARELRARILAESTRAEILAKAWRGAYGAVPGLLEEMTAWDAQHRGAHEERRPSSARTQPLVQPPVANLTATAQPVTFTGLRVLSDAAPQIPNGVHGQDFIGWKNPFNSMGRDTRSGSTGSYVSLMATWQFEPAHDGAYYFFPTKNAFARLGGTLMRSWPHEYCSIRGLASSGYELREPGGAIVSQATTSHVELFASRLDALHYEATEVWYQNYVPMFMPFIPALPLVMKVQTTQSVMFHAVLDLFWTYGLGGNVRWEIDDFCWDTQNANEVLVAQEMAV